MVCMELSGGGGVFGCSGLMVVACPVFGFGRLSSGCNRKLVVAPDGGCRETLFRDECFVPCRAPRARSIRR